MDWSSMLPVRVAAGPRAKADHAAGAEASRDATSSRRRSGKDHALVLERVKKSEINCKTTPTSSGSDS